MKIYNMFIAALMAGVTFSSCQSNPEKPAEEKPKDSAVMALAGTDSTGDTLSTSIPVDSANKMINSYLMSIGGQTAGQENLYSLIMDAGSMRAYLSNPNIKKFKIMFAHTLDYINSGHSGQNAGYGSGKLTLIIAGYDAAGNYVMDTRNGVEDHLQPCPHNCPSQGTASSNTITP